MAGYLSKDGVRHFWEKIKNTFQPKGNYLTKETDPTVPSWAKTTSKPVYTSGEVGADPAGSANTALANAKTYTDDVIREADFATKQYVAQQVGQNVLKKQIVTSLPTTSIDQNTIYMMLKADAAGNDNYNEYINLTGTTAGWEFLGNTNVNLADYYKKSETNDIFLPRANIDSALSLSSINPIQNKAVKAALDEVFQSVSSGKAQLAAVITDKGYAIAATAEFAAMVANIAKIGSEADAAAAQILSGKKAYVENRYITGTMTNNGAVTNAINAGGSYTIPAGYHNGSGKVTGNTLASQTAGTATAAQILSGQTAWVGGTKLTGTMTNNGPTYSTQKRLSAHESYTVPVGYHSGNLEISCNAYSLYRFSAPTRTSSLVLTVDLSKISDYRTLHVNCMFIEKDYNVNAASLSSSTYNNLTKSYVQSTGLLTLKYSGSSGAAWSGTASYNAFTLLIINDTNGTTLTPLEM